MKFILSDRKEENRVKTNLSEMHVIKGKVSAQTEPARRNFLTGCEAHASLLRKGQQVTPTLT